MSKGQCVIRAEVFIFFVSVGNIQEIIIKQDITNVRHHKPPLAIRKLSRSLLVDGRIVNVVRILTRQKSLLHDRLELIPLNECHKIALDGEHRSYHKLSVL